MGVVSLLNTSITLLKTGAGLGISQSVVRDVSEANGANDHARFSRIISLTNRIILVISVLGVILTIILSPLLSHWSFGNETYIVSFVWLSIVVGVNIMTEGQLAILKGMRQLHALAKASMIGALAGLFTALPFYYFLGEGGVVPSLIISAFSTLFFSNYFVRRIKYDKIDLNLREVYRESVPMVRMGIALMFSSFLISLASLIISSYIRKTAGLVDVGLYNAGTTIIVGYFGIVVTALSTDYYPRIAAVYKDNFKLQDELNKQSLVSLVITIPIIVLFLFLLPFFVRILYSTEFLPVVDFVRIGVFGTLVTIISNQVDMILVAKFNMKAFTIISIIYRIIQVVLSVALYHHFGLVGIGVALMLLGIIHILFMVVTVNSLYGIRFSYFFVKIALVAFTFVLSAIWFSGFQNFFFRFLCGFILFIVSSFFSLHITKKYLYIDFFTIARNRLLRR